MKLTIDDTKTSFLDFFMSRYGYFKEEDLCVLKEEFKVSFKETFEEYLKSCPSLSFTYSIKESSFPMFFNIAFVSSTLGISFPPPIL